VLPQYDIATSMFCVGHDRYMSTVQTLQALAATWQQHTCSVIFRVAQTPTTGMHRSRNTFSIKHAAAVIFEAATALIFTAQVNSSLHASGHTGLQEWLMLCINRHTAACTEQHVISHTVCITLQTLLTACWQARMKSEEKYWMAHYCHFQILGFWPEPSMLTAAPTRS